MGLMQQKGERKERFAWVWEISNWLSHINILVNVTMLEWLPTTTNYNNVLLLEHHQITAAKCNQNDDIISKCCCDDANYAFWTEEQYGDSLGWGKNKNCIHWANILRNWLVCCQHGFKHGKSPCLTCPPPRLHNSQAKTLIQANTLDFRPHQTNCASSTTIVFLFFLIWITFIVPWNLFQPAKMLHSN